MPVPANTSLIVWEFLQWELTNDAAEASWAPTAQAYSVTLIIAEEKKPSIWTLLVERFTQLGSLKGDSL